MSTFKRILTEKKRRDYGRKGGQGGTQSTPSTPYGRRESSANIQDPSRAQSGGKPKTFSTRPGILYTTNAPSGTVLGGKTPEQADQEISTKQKKRGTQPSSAKTQRQIKGFGKDIQTTSDVRQAVRDTVAKNPTSSPELQRAQSPSAPEELVGQGAKEGRGRRYRQRRPSDTKATGISQARSSKEQAAYRQQIKREADKVLKSLRNTKTDTAARMSSAVDSAERIQSLRSRAAQQVDLAKTTRARTAPRPQPSAAQLSKFTTGQQKGYIGKSGAPTSKGIQTYTTRRVTRGFGDAGYDAAKRGVKDPLGAVRSVDNIVSRAASGDKVARSEVKRTYKTMTGRYKDIVPSSQRTKVGLASLNKPVTTSPTKVEAPKSTPPRPQVELPKTSPSSSGTGGSATTTTLVKTKTKPPELKLAQPPATTATKVDLPNVSKTKVTKSVTRPTDRMMGINPSPTSGPALTPAQQKRATQKILQSAQPQLGRRLSPRTVPNLAAKVNAQAATKTAAKTTLRGTIGRGLAGTAGAAFDVVQGREDAKKAGASDRRAWLRGAARAAGGLLGATAGGLAGGGFGSFALGTAGYMAGSQAADKLFTSLAGGTQKQKDWLRQRNLATQAGTKSADIQYRKGNQAVVFDKRVGKERIGTWDPTSQTYKAGMTNPTKAYTAKNPFERLGRQFARSNEGSGLFGMNLVKGYGLADMAKRYYAGKDEAARKQRISDFKRTANR